MKKLIQLGYLLFALLTLAACSEKTVQVKGNQLISAQNRQVAPFTCLHVVGTLRLVVTVGGSQHVSVVTDENLQPYILTIIKRKTLNISIKKGFALLPSQPIRIQVNANELKKLTTAGATQVNGKGIYGDAFDVNATGDGRLTLAGKVNNVTYTLTGSTQLDAQHLLAENVNAKLRGNTKADVFVSHEMYVKIHDTGSVIYYGTPPIVNEAVFDKGKLKRIY